MTSALRAKIAARNLYTFGDIDALVWHALESWGVDFEAVTNLVGPIVRQSVTFLEDSSFVYDELGENAFLIVVAGEDAETPVDILAWSARDPEIFGTLLHQAVLLGADRVLNPASYYAETPCPLWRTPLSWLQAGCEGAVVLAPTPAAVTLAKAPGDLIAEDVEHARELVRSGAIPSHKILVPLDTLARAA